MPPRRNKKGAPRKPPSSAGSSSRSSSSLSPVKSPHSTLTDEPEPLPVKTGRRPPARQNSSRRRSNLVPKYEAPPDPEPEPSVPEIPMDDALLGQMLSMAESDDPLANIDIDDALSSVFMYPAAVEDFTTLPPREQAFKVARFAPCQEQGCSCPAMQPPEGVDVLPILRDQMDTGDSMESANKTAEGWWRTCGECGHGWEDGGHVWPENLSEQEKVRRGRVVGRIEELLQDQQTLTTFPTPQTPDVMSLMKQLSHFTHQTGGKKPVAPLPPALDLSQPGSPYTPIDTGTPGTGSQAADMDIDDDARPRKRRRGRANGAEEHTKSPASSPKDPAASPRKGKKPGGKTAGKGTKPRTVVRGARGLVPMETDEDGNVHVAGQLPESAQTGEKEEAGDEEDEEDEDDVPLAQRPTLDEGERRRREMVKEKAKEREAEVVSRLTKGVTVEGGADAGKLPEGVEVDTWEGVDLPKLPPRPAAIEESKREIMLTVVASRNPTPVATILLIGLKNLFQKQLPKMPREYITRLVLDKNHISMAIVKRGWKVVGGICYRPFESRGFAEIVFCAVDSSEQIKGYGSHLMNSLKDHVRRAHPTINHFLTYADNYAVGYFKKQGFTKEISLDRAKWVGYIKDYEGGTIMQCTMLPKVRYVDVHQMLADQKAAILAKIRTISKSHEVHSGLQVFKKRKEGEEMKVDKSDVPGLAESGWNPELDHMLRQPKRNPHHILLSLVLNDLQNENSAWPFVKPVDPAVVHDYYDVIKEPMDLSTMESKLEGNHYESVEDFMADARLIFENCKAYNGQNSTYTIQAKKLEKALDRIMKKRAVVE